jgi:hypothetical protein
MAIDPSALYPGQVIIGDPDYPRGKARNVTVAGDGSGTPLEAQVVNDIWGFQQALLDAVQVSPSGTPDTAGVSQYLDAIKSIATSLAETEAVAAAAPKVTAGSARYVMSGSGYSDNDIVALAEDFADADIVLSGGGTVTVTEAGRYLVSIVARVTTTSVVDPIRLLLGAYMGGVRMFFAESMRFNADPAQGVGVAGSAVFDISDPPTEPIRVRANSSGDMAFSGGDNNRLSIVRVG